MKMSEVARGYYDSMLRGEIPPHNWDRNVTKREKRKIYDAYVEYYIGLVKDGKKLPKRWPCKALNDAQKQKIYDARGFGSTDRLNGFAGAKKVLLREEKKREADEYWKCHGGYKTKETMEIAKKARRKRNEFRRNRSILKMIRRGVSKNLIDVNQHRTIPDYYDTRWYCFTYCQHRRSISVHKTPPSLSKMRPGIVETAKHDAELIQAFEYIKREYPDNWVVEYVEGVGLFNARDYVVKQLPRFYDSKFFTNYRESFIGKSFEYAIYLEREILKSIEMEQLSRKIKSNGCTPSESARQLRALGLVA